MSVKKLITDPDSKHIQSLLPSVSATDAFMLFCQCLKPQMDGVQQAFAIKIMADEWQKLSKDTKRKYKDITRNKRGDCKQEDVIDLDTHDEVADKAFIIFCKEMETLVRRNHDFIVMEELMQQIQQKWKFMSESDKQYYRDLAEDKITRRVQERPSYKKPVPPYFAFSNKLRNQIKQTNPEAKSKEIN